MNMAATKTTLTLIFGLMWMRGMTELRRGLRGATPADRP
jgi:hypothetical protein